jgi:hypothetical protein
MTSIDQPEKTLELIEGCLKPKENEKKQFGEVFTPMELVNEMLDKLPVDVWSNKNLRWFDPAVGMGNFMIGVYLRLIETLTCIEDIKERKKHILEKMLFMCELNKKNVFITKQIFDIHGEYKLNIYQGDTLLFDPVVAFGVSHFDIIVGNPPYQASTETGLSKGGGNNLYSKFIYKGWELLNETGYLLYITPPTFFSIGRSGNKDNMNLKKDIFNKSFIHYINLEECNRHFNVGSKFVYYLIQKIEKPNKLLNVVCKYSKAVYNSILNQETLNSFEYLPYLLTNESLSICKKIKENDNVKLNIFHSPDNRGDKKHIKKNETTDYCFPMQMTGSQVKYSSKECKNQKDKKVLMSRSGYLKPFYDNGILGVGGDIFSILLENENDGKNKINLLNTPLYKFYIEINKWSGFHHKKVLQDLPDIVYTNNEDLYLYFGLTQEEIKLIEKNVK